MKFDKEHWLGRKFDHFTAIDKDGPIDLITNARPTIGATPEIDSYGARGLALKFAVEGEYIEYDNSLFPTLTQALTITFRTRMQHGSGTDPTDTQYLLDTTTGNNAGIRILNYAGSDHPRFRLFTTGATNLGSRTNTFAAGDFIDWAFTYDGSNMRTYQNGLQIDSVAKTGNINNPSDNWRVGRGLGQAGAGTFELFNFGVAAKVLDADEVAELYRRPHQLIIDDDVIVIRSAAAAVTGSGTLVSGSATMSGTGTHKITGSGVLAAASSNISGTGNRGASASGVLFSGPATMVGTGARKITGSGILLSNESLVSGDGSTSGAISGSGNLVSDASIIVGIGLRNINGNGVLLSQDSAVTGNGGAAGTVSGSGILVSAISFINGIGTRKVIGSGSLLSNNSVVNGFGSVGGATSGLGNLTANNSIISGIGLREIIGNGSLLSGVSLISGNGLSSGAIAGSGALQAGPAIINGSGFRKIIGSGNLLSDVATLSGQQLPTEFILGSRFVFFENRGDFVSESRGYIYD